MISYIIALEFIIIIVCSFVVSNNKFINGVLVFSMWILMAFSSETADFAIYNRRFYYPSTEALEPLFFLLTQLFRKMGLNLNFFIAFVMTMYVYELYRYLKLKAFEPFLGFILVMYCIYPFCMDICQIRNTLGFIPILIGVRYLESEEDRKKQKLSKEAIFIVCLLISTLFHYGGIFYIILFIAKKINIKKSIIITVIADIVFLTIHNFEDLILLIASKLGDVPYRKIWTLMNNTVMHNRHTIEGTQRMMIFTFLLIMFFLILAYKKRKDKYIEYVIKINILVMMTVPLLEYAVDIFRIQRYLLVFTYAALTLCLYPKRDSIRKIKMNVILAKISWMLVPASGLYLNVIASDIFQYVVVPIFSSNLLFK